MVAWEGFGAVEFLDYLDTQDESLGIHVEEGRITEEESKTRSY